MLPKKIPTYVLLIIWAIGTLPFLIITFWLKDIPAPQRWMFKAGEIVSGFSSSFSTAFPFWWVVEWFQRRNDQVRVASLQRQFIDDALIYLNSMLDSACNDYRAKKPIAAHPDKERVNEALEHIRLIDRTKPFALSPLTGTLTFFGHLLRGSMDRLNPYRGMFTPQFNRNIEHVVTDFELSLRPDSEAPIENALLELRTNLRDLEDFYRKENGLPLIRDPYQD